MAAKFYRSLCMVEVQTCPLTTENVYKISQPLLCVYFQPLSLSNWQLYLFWGARSSGINVFPLICPSQKVKNLGGEEIRRLVTFCIHVLFLLGYSIKKGTQIFLRTFLGVARSNSKSNSTLKEREHYGKTLNIDTELNDYTFLVTGSSNVISDEWACEEGRNKYFDGTRYNRAWVLGRVHHG